MNLDPTIGLFKKCKEKVKESHKDCFKKTSLVEVLKCLRKVHYKVFVCKYLYWPSMREDGDSSFRSTNVEDLTVLGPCTSRPNGRRTIGSHLPFLAISLFENRFSNPRSLSLSFSPKYLQVVC